MDIHPPNGTLLRLSENFPAILFRAVQLMPGHGTQGYHWDQVGRPCFQAEPGVVPPPNHRSRWWPKSQWPGASEICSLEAPLQSSSDS
jgi:hypothetical protein